MTSKGQLTVPKGVRERLGLEPGDEIEFVERRGAVVLRKRRRRTSLLRPFLGCLRHLEGRDPDELVRTMRGDE